MSVCIVMQAEGGKHGERLVCVTDNRVAFGDFSGEHLALKAEVLFPGWGVLFAGNDVEHAPPIIRSAEKKILVVYKRKRDLEPEDVSDALSDAYSEHLQTQIESKILRKHRFDGESFLNAGKIKCTPEVYAKVWDRVDRERLSLTFIVYGFDRHKKGCIWVVDGENAPVSYDSIGFWSIGKRAPAALSTIAFHKSRDRALAASLENTVYVALTAKFMAQAASDVGPSTFAAVLSAPSDPTSCIILTQEEIARVRTLWEKSGIPHIKKYVSEFVKQLLETAGKDMETRIKEKEDDLKQKL